MKIEKRGEHVDTGMAIAEGGIEVDGVQIGADADAMSVKHGAEALD